MSGTAENVARYQHQIFLLCFFAEGVGIRFQGTREHIEGAARFHAGVAVGEKSVVKNLFVLLVDGQVGSVPAHFGDSSLHERGGAVLADGP